MLTSSIRKRLALTIALFIVVVGAISLALFTAGLRNAAIPLGTPSGDIAFMTNRDGTWDVYAMDTEGVLTNLMSASDGPTAHDYFASWSLDSQRMNVLSNRTGDMGPTQIEPNGANPRNLDVVSAIFTLFGEGRLDWDAFWSPDGARVAWSSLRDLNLELYVIPTDSDFTPEAAVRLTNHPARDWFGAWSPDGDRIAFSSDRAGNEDIYLISADGGEPIQLTNSPWDELRPAWSLDGQTLLYVSDEDDALVNGQLRLMLMDADGNNQRPLSDALFRGGAVYSPQGDETLYMSNEEGDWNIYLMNNDGSDLRRLTEGDSDDLFPVWRP